MTCAVRAFILNKVCAPIVEWLTAPSLPTCRFPRTHPRVCRHLEEEAGGYVPGIDRERDRPACLDSASPQAIRCDKVRRPAKWSASKRKSASKIVGGQSGRACVSSKFGTLGRKTAQSEWNGNK